MQRLCLAASKQIEARLLDLKSWMLLLFMLAACHFLPSIFMSKSVSEAGDCQANAIAWNSINKWTSPNWNY